MFLLAGYNDITYMVVNLQGDTTSQNIHYLTNRVSFPVYQDTPSLNIWSTLDGKKDDILVYDRCGQLSYHARMPYSNLQYNIVQQTIQYTFYGYDPCNCNPTTPKPMTIEPSTELLTTILDDDNLLLDEEEAAEMVDLHKETEGQSNEEEAEQDTGKEVEEQND